MKQQRKNKHLLPAILTVLAILSSLLGILPAGSVSAADVTAYPAQAVHFGAYTTNRNLNNAGSAANTQKAAGANSEDWRIDYVSAGVYQIVSLTDGKYLTANGTACTLTAKAADSSQNWNIESVQKDFEGYDLYYKITSVSTGAALTYYQGNNTIGLTAYTGDGAQKWKLNCSGLEGYAANALANGKEKAGTIGGLLGETVFVSTADDLEKQLNTTEPKTIVITADIDMQNKSHTRIRDNKTIVGSYGNKTIYDSQFRTNDTYGAVDDNPSDNIIFRNLNMIAKNVKNRILINIWSSRQIWVDHCTFISYLPSDHTGNGQDEVGKFIWLNTPYESYLDAKDNGRSPDYITISYNTFKNRFWTVAYGTQNSETSRCRTTLMYNWWDECVRRCPQIGNGSGHIYNNYYSGDDSFLPNSCNQIISGEGSNMVSENCRFQAVSGREIIVQPDTSPYRDNGSYTAKSSSETPTKLNYTAKVTSTWNPKDNYGYTLLDAYNTRGTDTKDFCTKYAGAASSSGELKYITDSSLQTFAATVYTAPFLTDSFDSAYGNPVTDYTPAVLQEGAVYMIQNVNSGLYLEVDGGKAEDGSNVQQWGANEPAAHNSWTLKEFGGGYYYILSALADGKTYYLNSAGEADGSNIEIHTNNKSSSHLFKFVKNPDGTYTILTRTSKDRAAVEVANAEKSSGANVQQWTVNGNACQKWNAVAFTTTAATTTTTTTTTTTATAAKTTAATVPATATANTSKTTATSAQEQTTVTTATTLPAATSAATETETAASTQATVSETTAATTSLTEQDTTTLSSAETTAATSATTATESSGTSPTTETVIFGDVNLDGKVDISDAVLLNKTVAGTISLSESAQKNADCDGDGETGSNDAVVLLRFLVHLIQTLPSTE